MITVGNKVFKPDGYSFPGTVVAVFSTLAGKKRFVVESEVAPGMLHIFSEAQLQLAAAEEPCPKCGHAWKLHEQPDPYRGPEAHYYPGICTYYVGMGDVCGCDRKVPDAVR